MSLTFSSHANRTQLAGFLAAEYKKDTGIPIHLFSVVNATFEHYNKMLAITDNCNGTIFLEEPKRFKSYGSGDPTKMVKVLNRCSVGLTCIG